MATITIDELRAAVAVVKEMPVASLDARGKQLLGVAEHIEDLLAFGGMQEAIVSTPQQANMSLLTLHRIAACGW